VDVKITLALLGILAVAAAIQPPAARLEFTALSSDPSRVTGGDVLVQVTAPASLSNEGQLSVTSNGPT
jgi:hypothetical protein